YGSASSMSSATVTPSLVTFGEPQPLSSTALRPRGPRVLRTARASLETPASSGCRASSSKTICFDTSVPPGEQGSGFRDQGKFQSGPNQLYWRSVAAEIDGGPNWQETARAGG